MYIYILKSLTYLKERQFSAIRQDSLFTNLKTRYVMRKFANRLLEDTKKRIGQEEADQPDVVLRALSLTGYMEDTIGRLKAYILTYTFRDDAEEIAFFKEIKPEICRYLLYYRKLYYIEINRPYGCTEQQREYLKKELSRLQLYIERRRFLYNYYRCGATHLDSYFFLRRNIHMRRAEHYGDSFSFERDPSFSTLCDFGIAKIRAHEMLRQYLLEELARLEHPGGEYGAAPVERLTWTHSKTELIELLYSLDTDGCFNYGKVPLHKISSYFEQAFNIKIGSNISRNFYDMRIRHRPTPFLDRLRDRLIKRMNDFGDETDNKKTKPKK